MLLSPTAVHPRRTWATLWATLMAIAPAGASVRRPQPVADAGLRQNIVRALGIGFDLLPELADIDAQILCVGQFVPQLLQEKAVGQHFAGVLHQDAQQVVFSRRQFDIALAELDDAADQIDREISGAEDRPRRLAARLTRQPPLTTPQALSKDGA